jgi:hypothetical protein
MIISTSESAHYRTRFSNGTRYGMADTVGEKGGGDSGFRPHDLLEAAEHANHPPGRRQNSAHSRSHATSCFSHRGRNSFLISCR